MGSKQSINMNSGMRASWEKYDVVVAGRRLRASASTFSCGASLED